MKSVWMFLVLGLLTAGSIWAQQDPRDAGLADTLRFGGGPLVVGESRPVEVVFFTDMPVSGLSFCPKFASLDSGFAHFDSIVYVNHLADPSVLDMRFSSMKGIDGTSPDSFTVGMIRYQENALPPVHEVVMRIYLTGVQPGRMLVDTGHGFAGGVLKFVTSVGGHRPLAVSNEVEILPADPGPQLSLPQVPLPFTLSAGISLSPGAQSPIGRPVTITGCRVANYDDSTRQPAGTISFNSGNPAAFAWTPTATDLGMWYVVFTACDDELRCSADSLIIEVVATGEFALTFDQSATVRKTPALALLRGDFNSDGFDEFVTANGAGADSGEALAVFRLNDDTFEKTYRYADGFLKKGLQVGYVDGDDRLDFVAGTTAPQTDDRQLRTFLGNGDATFSMAASTAIELPTSGTLAEFTGDQYLDYVLVRPLAYQMFRGSAGGVFSPIAEIGLTDSVKSVTSTDLNGDGATDMLIGTVSGINVFLNNDSGTFTLSNSYAQDFRALDLDVTTQGTDFNNDGFYDLSVATPSVGGEYSEIIVYLGGGDGTFSSHLVRTMRGQAFATVIGDFNNDLDLDIAYTNSARKYIGVLYGDGTGAFPNEQRFFTPVMVPRALEASDVDRDGDLDLVVGSYYKLNDSKLMLLRNRLDPPGYMSAKLAVAVLNNGQAEITSPSGQTLNAVKRTIASGSAFSRDADHNDVIDEVLAATAIETGSYSIRVLPRPGRSTTDIFSLDFSVDDKKFRLAQNQPNRTGGYQFTVYPDGSSPVIPAPGVLLTTPNPQLNWTSSGEVKLEIARDLAFSDIIETATLSTGSFMPTVATGEGGDTITYYWRVKNVEAEQYSEIWVFSVMPTPTGVDPEAEDGLPADFSLAQNYPNPFNPTTTIAFALPSAEHVTITIFDVTGRRVKLLADREYQAGEHRVTWDGTDNRHRTVGSGVYFYRLEAGSYRAQKKMTLVR